jgi:Flp pilus assembly protein TadD
MRLNITGLALGMLFLGSAVPALAHYSHYDQGCYLLGQGKVDDAVLELRQSLAIDPKDPAVHQALGQALERQGDKAQAMQEWQKALDLSSTDAQAYGNGPDGKPRPQGWIQDAQEAQRAARAALLAALQSQAEAATAAGRFEDAAASYRQATGVDPSSALLWRGLGASLRRAQRLDAALEAYDHAASLDPTDAGTQKARGYLNFALNDITQSVEAFAKYTQLMPSDAVGHNNLGAALALATRYGEAKQSFQRALDLDPGLATARTGMGAVLYDTGDFTHARQAWTLVLQSQPENASAKEDIRTLNQMGY